MFQHESSSNLFYKLLQTFYTVHTPLASSSSSSQAPAGSFSCPSGSQEPRHECKGKKKSLHTGHIEQQIAQGRNWQGGCDSRAGWVLVLGAGVGGAAPWAPPAQGRDGTRGWISCHTKTWLTGKITSFPTNSVAPVGLRQAFTVIST